MSQTLGLGRPAQGFVPYADGMAQARPVAAPAMTPEADRIFAAAMLTGGNNSIEDPASVRRQYLLALQRDVQRERGIIEGQRMIQQEQLRRQAEARSNGVVDGIAYRNGQPVGFRGEVAGIESGVRPGGFNPQEQQLFNRQLMAMVNPPAVQPMGLPMPVDASIRGALAGAPLPVSVPVTAAGLPDDTPEAASRFARERRGMPFQPIQRDAVRQALMGETGGAGPSGRPQVPGRQGLSIAQAVDQEANITRGLEARQQIKTLESSLASVLPQIAEMVGTQVDADALANQILAEEEWSRTQQGPSPYISELPVVNFFLPLGIDPKIALRWAQDRKKARS